jgi:hypothetical protein
MASRRVAVAIDEALMTFDPPMTYRQLAALIAALGIRPVGKRKEPRRGRPRLILQPDFVTWLDRRGRRGTATV